jgi:hypothetical protein
VSRPFRIIDPNVVTLTIQYNKKTGGVETNLSEDIPFPALTLVLAAVISNFSNQTLKNLAAAAGHPANPPGGNNNGAQG